MDIRPTPAQLLLPPIFVAYDRSSTTQGGSSGHSDRASRRQQSRNDLMQLFSVVSPNTSPKLVESVVSRYTTISSLRTAMCAEFEGLQLWYGTPPTPDDINDLLSLIRYSGVLISYRGSYVTRTMCKEMDSDHYIILYITDLFATPATPRNSVDNSMITYVDYSIITSIDNSTIPSVDDYIIPSMDNSKIPSVDKPMIYPGDNPNITSGYSSRITSVDPLSSSDIMRSNPSTITSVVKIISSKIIDRKIR